MRAWGALIVLVACGTPVRTAPPRDRPPPAPGDAAVDAAPARPNALVPIDARRRLIEAPHGAPIALVAATADGSAVVSADELGGVRLWPALDGTVEPRIVDLPAPRSLAVAAERRGFVIAMVDSVGGLVLQVVDRDGLAVQRASFGAEPAHRGVELTGAGALAWRADETLVLVDGDGTLLAELPAEARQRIVGVAAAGGRALAVIEEGAPGTRRARWITLAPKLAWGAWLPGTGDLGPMIALSPSGKRLATLLGIRSGLLPHVRVVDTQTGAEAAAVPAAAEPSFAFADDDHLAVTSASTGTMAWVDLTNPTSHRISEPASDLALPRRLAGGGGRAIGASSGELVIATPTSQQFLGYDVPSPTVVAPGASGRLLAAIRQGFVTLDDELREVAGTTVASPTDARPVAACWLRGNAWLVERAATRDGKATLELVDAASGRGQVVKTGLTLIDRIAFEPSTGLVTLSRGDLPEVRRYDAARNKLVPVGSLARERDRGWVELVPLAHSLAGGAKVLVAAAGVRLTLRWATDPAQLTQGTSITVDGALAAADRAGNAYVFESEPGGIALAVYAGGKRVGALPSQERVFSVWPAPSGGRIARATQRGFGVVATDGTMVWALPLFGVNEAVWLDDGSLAIVTVAGIARLDAATGALRAARCGWRFGLSRLPHPSVARVEPVCSQLR